jgi:serine protease Do
MFKYKKIYLFILLLVIGTYTNVLADHTYKTSVVKKILPMVVEVHSEKKVVGFKAPRENGGFQFRDKSPQNPQRRGDPREQPSHVGSGFVISEDGYIITNAHVINNMIDGGTATIVFYDDSSYNADLINYDEASDIALLKINNAPHEWKFPFLEWGNKPEMGEDVIAIGSPMNQSFSVSFGVVSSLDRFIPNASPHVPFIQSDAAVNPGNSGGPLFNIHGKVVGINTLIISGEARGHIGLSFSIDGTYAQTVIEKLKTGEKINWPYLGILYRPVQEEDVKTFKYGHGVFIQEIVPDSPSAGILLVGDIILSIDGKPLKWKMFASIVKMKNIGDVVQLKVIRDNMIIPIKMILGGK